MGFFCFGGHILNLVIFKKLTTNLMIKFFRRIRQNLLSEGKTGKYLKYAIGEIVLVVIGILIALQINDWNENRKDRIEEQKILNLLKDEFTMNLAQLKDKIGLRNYIMQQSSTVIDYIDEERYDINLDTLIQTISAIVLAPTFDPIDNELLTSEGLKLIRSDSLKRYLSNWKSSVSDLKEQEKEWVTMYNNITVPFLLDFGISRNVQLSFFNDSNNLNYMQDKGLSGNIRLKKSTKSPSVKEILTNKKLEGILANAVIVNQGVNWESLARVNQIKKILGLIENEIE
jgi:hypothetical protein